MSNTAADSTRIAASIRVEAFVAKHPGATLAEIVAADGSRQLAAALVRGGQLVKLRRDGTTGYYSVAAELERSQAAQDLAAAEYERTTAERNAWIGHAIDAQWTSTAIAQKVRISHQRVSKVRQAKSHNERNM